MKTTHSLSQPTLLQGEPARADLLVRFREEVEGSARRPVNVALVIDRSGSMAGAPLRYALQAAADVVDRLGPDDLISVVVYDDEVQTIVEPQPVTDKAALKASLAAVRAGGLTNLSGGWLRGCELVARNRDGDRVNRVLLLTDGQANMGVTDPRVLTSSAAKKAEEGVSTTTLGFGNGFDEDLLIGMARAAGGNFYFIQSVDDAAEVFGLELDTLKAVAAQNLTVTVTPAPGVTVADVLGLARAETRPDGSLVLHLGDVYENEDKLLGLQLDVSNAGAGPALDLLRLDLRADVVKGGVLNALEAHETIAAAVGDIDAVASNVAGGGAVLDLARLRIARDKERAVDLVDAGKADEAEALLRALVAHLNARGLGEHFEFAEEIDQLTHFADRIARRALSGDSRKELRDQSFQGASRGRADLVGRGVTVDDAALGLAVVQDLGANVEVACFREGGKLRVHAVSDGFDANLNVQFPRSLRAEGARYAVERLELSQDGSFYRAVGAITRLVRPGEADPLGTVRRASGGSSRAAAPKAAKAPMSVADLPETDSVGGGVLIQCVKDGGKLRARVVSDGFDPNWNMRFPRSIRQEGLLFVVDAVNTAPDGKSYIASGEIKRFVQTA